MDVVKRLQNHNIKPSVQRIAIMNYLIEHRTHPTVDGDVMDEIPPLSILREFIGECSFYDMH